MYLNNIRLQKIFFLFYTHLYIQSINNTKLINREKGNMNMIPNDVFSPLFSEEQSYRKIIEVIGQFKHQSSPRHLQEINKISQSYPNCLHKQNPFAIIKHLDKTNAQGLQNLTRNEFQGVLKGEKATLQPVIKIGLLYEALIHLKSISLLQALFKKNITNFNVKNLEETYDSTQMRQTPTYLIRMVYQIFTVDKQLLTKIIDYMRKENINLLFEGLQFYNLVCNNEDSKFCYGKALIQHGRIEEGIKILSQIEESPAIRSLEAMEIIASNFKKIQMFGDAIKYYQRMIDQDKGETQFSTISACKIGVTLKTLYFLPQSLHYFQKSITYNKLRTPKQRKIKYKAIMEIAQLFKSQSYPVPIEFIEVISNLQQITSRSKIQAYLCFAESKIGQSHKNCICNKLNQMLQNDDLPPQLMLKAGKVYLLIGNLLKAKQLLQNMSQPYQQYLHLSYMNRKQGKIITGRSNFQNALSIKQYQTIKHEYFLSLFHQYYKKEDAKYQITHKLSEDIKRACDEYYQKGLEYKRQNQYFQSLAQFKKIKIIDQSRNDYIIHVVEIFIACQRFNDALNLLEMMVKNGHKQTIVLDRINKIYIQAKDVTLKKYIISRFPFVAERKPSQFLSNNGSNQQKLGNFELKLSKLNFNSFKPNPLWQLIKIRIAFYPNHLKQTQKVLQKAYKHFYLDCCNLKVLAKMCIQKGINKYAERFLSRALKMKPFDEEIINLYIIYLENKNDFSQEDLQSFRRYTSSIKIKNYIKIKIAQLYCSLTQNTEAIKILIQIISKQPTFQEISIFQATLKKLQYSEQESLLIILKYNNNIKMIHERLAFIYRFKKDHNREIYHQQQIIKLFWDKQKALDRLVQLYKVANKDGDYIESMKKLSLIQCNNRELRLRLADELRKRKRYHQEIEVLMRELRNRQLDKAIHQLIFVACKQLNEDNFCLINIFHIDERPLYYMQLSFYYLHIKQLKESMKFYILAIEHMFFHQTSEQSSRSKKTLKDSLAQLEKPNHSQYAIDIIIKQAIFSKYSEKHQDYLYYIFKIERKQDHELPNLKKRKKIIQQLSEYSYWQKLYIIKHVLDCEGQS